MRVLQRSFCIGIRLQHTAAYCNILQRPVSHCNRLQHTATHTSWAPHVYVCVYTQRESGRQWMPGLQQSFSTFRALDDMKMCSVCHVCDMARCTVLQCAAVCCSVAVCCSLAGVIWCVTVFGSVLHRCSMLQSYVSRASQCCGPWTMLECSSACGTCDVVCCSMLQCNSRLQRCSAAAFLCCSVAVLNCRSHRASRHSSPWEDANVNCVCGTCGMLQCCSVAGLQWCSVAVDQRLYTHICIFWHACM